MTFRTPSALAALLMLAACSNDVTGQKGRNAPLVTMIDSVSYGIGTDIGNSLRMASLDSLNVDAIAMGMRDALDSNERIPSDQVRKLVQNYQIEAQKRLMAKEQQLAEVNLQAGEAFLLENGKRAGVTTTASGLQYEVLQMGTGPKPANGQGVRVDYRGTLIDGTEFDSSYKRGQPAEFGVDMVIPGWTEALMLMPKGSRWKLYIPADLAYGASKGPGGKLPPYSTLIFEVDLLDVLPAQEQGR
ncbi:MAG: FKBP-type peptidyl-prolyl cis-trans isomerase [Flavobacteriales bacterium]|nr:FKBP-type peptidyl-prolyl cis-trans isomerase [Flavobacteriales bacterium]